MTIRLLHPALATERMVDVEGYCRCSQAQGEPELQGMVSAILVSLEPEPEDERVRRRIIQAWWQVHYWGRPSRERERDLALLRAVAYLPERQALAYLRR